MKERIVNLADERKLGFAEYGVSEGVPILFFHGTPGSRFHPALNKVEALKHTTSFPSVRIIVVERPGYGLSDSHSNRTLESWANDVKELLDQLGLVSVSLIGVSGGAPYALACSYLLQERVHKTAILSGIGPVYIEELVKQLSPEELHPFRNPESLSSYTQSIHADPSAFVHGILSSFTETERANFTQNMIDDYIQMLFEATKVPNGMISDYQIFGKPWNIEFGDIKTPIQFWHSESDVNVPISQAEYLVSMIPNAKLIRLTGLNHYAASNAPLLDAIGYLIR